MTKNVCGQTKMDKNSVINVTSLNCQPISQESLAIFLALIVVSGKRKIDNPCSRVKGLYLFYYFLNGKRDKRGTKGTKNEE